MAPDAPRKAPVQARTSRIKDSTSYKVFTVVNTTALLLMCAMMLYPFVMLLAQSFSSAGAINAGKVSIFPVDFNLDTYKAVADNGAFWRSYGNTVVYTVIGTTIAMVLTTTYAFVLSKKHLRGRGLLIGIAVFTMFFNGGIVPNYVLISSLGMKNTMWAVILPPALSVFNLLVMKAFFENLPSELEEAAHIDGLTWFGIFFRIVLPLSKAVIATMVLFYSVQYWNDWFAAFLYLDRTDLFPVTLFLRNLIAGASTAASEGAAASGASVSDLNANIQSVTMILILIPILCVYPFVQRYFVSGIMLGSVKG
ncbi:carbohydrate ABC transporter permease [Brachybacterium alimentarium]|uniref:Sugar ABC transporter permease n=1 Tax=Brachybacterium alimentarium TaxID=47845 RepID=A0A2A3YP89_9MICO|nr:carbohydrate ABC transporter permease [Brachybacterium alimentarium]PCC35454.1 sugar ABC transporter permease [Brachybacterium alimentarium]PCC41074.1 sugar ABC transporter permease [Brachybacterium alimentarium]RCS71137.1 carbohydrate ABC transporter permease [Brachybacterium alimentarium]RCS74648.1 carbohydrate ABC transporter permease [Brachybacterium alimentarium]RCS81606.1 carbohydrate ABC transporter permease [Brachybacterium alimentarium]